MGQKKFTAGDPACPVACKYCFITEHETRRELWNTNPLMGINKACSFVNVTPWIVQDPEEKRRFHEFPWEILRGDFVGFTAITDPFWPRIERYLWEWMEKAGEVAKITTCVTKWPISREVMKRLAQQPNFYLVLGMTGNWGIEKVSFIKHLNTLTLAKEYGVPCLPISHPYVAGLSDLSFLPEVKALGYEYFDVKGLRYDPVNMATWMPESSKVYYNGHEDEEILPEDGWRQQVEDAGLQLLSPRQWYLQEGKDFNPHLSEAEAKAYVAEVLKYANIVSSNSNQAVIDAAIARRL
jgi:hypothetical protein